MLSILTALRDSLIPLLPEKIGRFLVGKGAFAFIGHPRDHRDVYRMFPFAKWMKETWVQKWFYHQKPFIASKITGLKDKTGKAVNGWFIGSPLWTIQMLKDRKMASHRVLETVKLAQRIGVRTVGLGAFTSIVTHDGKDVVDKVQIGVTTGNPLSAAVAVQNVVKAAALIGLKLENSTLAVIGAAGSVGTGCVQVLARKVKKLKLIDINQKALKELIDSIQDAPCEIETSGNLSGIAGSDIVIVVTNAPGAIVHAEHFKPGAIVIDCAQPKNVSDEVPKKRNDIIVIESAIVETPGVDCHFDFDLNRNEALGCLAETMVLTAIGRSNTCSIGKVQAHQAEEIYQAARSLDFRLAYFRNSVGYIDESLLKNCAEIIAEKERKN
ncbi:MAG: hypothetical protein HYS08_02620 [Chlamydiae bacterium]|nr:hypothetical protein [Chlamydiota bacterium]MBI3266624.1 hypothetical protein [Chlamydiota bacterium]